MTGEAKSAARVCPVCSTRYEAGIAFCARDGAALVVEPARASLVGQVLAERYRIVRLVGEGGMGQVYEAQHVNINRRFAIKLLRPEIVTNADAVARFRQEAWSASSIGHENIIEIDDFATLPSGAVYLAMELLEGQSLSERMQKGGPLEQKEALELVLQLASGLGAAHEKGIIHRDMKPENVFLARKQERPLVKILDFGIAKVSGAEEQRSLTRTGTIFGTPHYMSPEQALGRPLDPRADLYSVGVIMYELFTGRVPFEAESFMGILSQHITTPPPPPRQVAPDRDIPPALEAVILRALAKEPEARYQSMAELATALRELPDLVGQAAAVEAPRDPASPRRAHGVWLGLGALALLAAVGALGWRARAPKAAAPTVQMRAKSAVATAPRPPARQAVVVDSEPAGAEIWVDGAKVGETPDALSVAVGSRQTLVLKKAGFQDRTEVIDPVRGRKLLVRLTPLLPPIPAARPHSPVKPAKAVKLPSKAGKKAKPPRSNRPAKAPLDPYERVDDTPHQAGGDVLNPY